MGPSDTFEEAIGKRLTALGATLAIAESCSGGLIAHRITNVPGASAYFLGGVVAYSNEAKTTLLGVAPETLETHGAVSEAVAREMAEGARSRFGSDWVIAVTGVAGPAGGTLEKPVGLVFITIASAEQSRVSQSRFEGTREEIKMSTADEALRLLWEQIA